MSKIICDVCGTSYPESATQCPICGCVRPIDVIAEVEDNKTNNRKEKYTYVKGGRYSRANVQKRNQGILHNDADQTVLDSSSQMSTGNKGDKGLVIAVCALLLAIVAVVIYIVIHFFAPADNNTDKPNNSQSTTDPKATVATTLDNVVESIPCTGIVLSKTEITLTSVGDSLTLEVVLNPENTTDELHFVSDDESVATVTENGEIIAVATGETVVTVSCGDASAPCRVICSIEEEPADNTTPEPTEAVGEYTAPYKINKSDVSISVGETFQLKLLDANGEIVPVTWSPTIADICTIDGNYITGAEKGKTEVSVTYEGETFTCIVRVR